MKITHFGHACVLVEIDGARILFDPGTLSHGFETLRNLTAILITHQHDDHADPERIPALLSANPDAVLIGTSETVEFLGTGTPTTPGSTIDIGGVSASVIGGRHRPVYGAVPDMANLGFVLGDGKFLHPGDALDLPDRAIDVLGLPVSGPWLKMSETIDFMSSIGPRIAIPMHEAGLSDPAGYYFILGDFTPAGTIFTPLQHGVGAEL